MIDPTDSIYQLNHEYKPDKESAWHYPAERDGWMHAHNAIRGEIASIRSALEAIEKRGNTLVAWKVKALKTVTDAHFEHIHGHHSNEDDVFVPEFHKRFRFPEKLETDHIGIVEKLSALEKMINNIKVGDGVQVITNLIQEWNKYSDLLLPHLAEEEAVGLPLMRAYYTPQEMAPLVQKLVARSTKLEVGSIIYFMGVNRCRSEFMKQEGIPFFVWYIDFRSKYNLFLKEFVNNIDALVSGNNPTTSKQRRFWIF